MIYMYTSHSFQTQSLGNYGRMSDLSYLPLSLHNQWNVKRNATYYHCISSFSIHVTHVLHIDSLSLVDLIFTVCHGFKDNCRVEDVDFIYTRISFERTLDYCQGCIVPGSFLTQWPVQFVTTILWYGSSKKKSYLYIYLIIHVSLSSDRADAAQ